MICPPQTSSVVVSLLAAGKEQEDLFQRGLAQRVILEIEKINNFFVWEMSCFFLLSNCLYAREVRLCHGHGLEERVPLRGGVADVEVDVVLKCIQRKTKKT